MDIGDSPSGESLTNIKRDSSYKQSMSIITTMTQNKFNTKCVFLLNLRSRFFHTEDILKALAWNTAIEKFILKGVYNTTSDGVNSFQYMIHNARPRDSVTPQGFN